MFPQVDFGSDKKYTDAHKEPDAVQYHACYNFLLQPPRLIHSIK